MKHLSKSGKFFVLLLASSLSSIAAPPDLINGGIPNTERYSNLGPTGLLGWAYHEGADSSKSRQIQVQEVDAGSPAAGKLALGDVILGADGTGADPDNFTADARKSFSNAINDAEARDPALLKVLRWRDGTITTQTLTLRTMGAYSTTAPYDCPKSAKILEEGLQAIMTGETAGAYSFGTLALLAANNPANRNNADRQTRAQTEARALIPDAATIARMKSGDLDELGPNALDPWQQGHELIVLTEYYLRTHDALVLPAIDAMSQCIITGQNLFGTYSHRYASKWRDGAPNGPMRNLYGTVNSASMLGWLGLLLTRECGVVNPDLNPAIERASRFCSYYAGRGAIPYGEHEAYWQRHENNGKSGLAALCFELESTRTVQQKMFAKMAVAAPSEREEGHTGPYFNYVWSPIGAAAGGEAAAASHFSRIRWMLDLNRRWNGLFAYDSLSGENANDGGSFSDFSRSTPALLTYALPLRQLHITGRGHDPLRWLSAQDVAEAAAVDAYDAASRSTSELVTDLGSWSPRVQRSAAQELENRPSETTALLPALHAMATDLQGTSRVGATFALGYIGHASSGAVLASLLTDSVNHVRFAAADAMREMPPSARDPHLNTVLAAAASTAAPLLPFNEEDPMHMAHSRFGPLLFNSEGMVPTNISSVDKNLLYPAIRAVASNPVGYSRSTLARIYDNLSQTEYLELADAVVYSAYELTPADKMFAYGDRVAAQKVLEKFNAAEGVPLCLLAIEDGMYGNITPDALATLELYAGGSKTVVPDPNVEAAMAFLIQTGTNPTEAQAVLAAIAADPTPATLPSLKSIQAVTADNPALTLPANWTNLRVISNDYAKGDSIYTWRKVHGAGNVSFTPNGTSSSKDTTVLLDGTPGQYLFEVKMSDNLGLTEVKTTVAVTLNPNSGSLPTNNPPVANSQSPSVPQTKASPITLSGSDPEGYALNYRLKSQPTHGKLTGTAPYLVYTSDSSYTGPDSFTFEVIDSEGQVSSTATVNLTVTAVSNPSGLSALSGSGTTGTLSEWDEADGYRFQTGASALTVNWLGIYDAPNDDTGTVGDGLQASHRVSIWRESDGVLMAQTTVLVSDALVGSFRRHDITPVTLAANTGYVIAADYGATGDRLMEGAVPSEWGVYSGISNLAGRYVSGGGMPTNDWSVMIGPNFGYTAVPSDNVSPSPNPMVFHQAPIAAGPSSINMVAATAFDASGVEYYFTSTTGGGHDSGWQDSPSYTDTGLTPGVLYSYTVKARDKSPAQNTTTSSTAASATISTQSTLPNMVSMQRTTAESIITMLGMTVGIVTLTYDSGLSAGTVLGQTPLGNQIQPLGTVVNLIVSGGDTIAPTPNPATFAVAPVATNSSIITMTATTGTDPSGVEYLFTETSGNPGGSSSNWQDSPDFTDSGLSAATQYTYTVTIRDKSPGANPTTPSAPTSTTTTSIPAASSWYWDGTTTDIATNGNGVSTGGNGTWNNALRNWDAGNTAHTEWNNAANKTAVFGGTAGTVTIGGGGVTVGDVQLTTANYIINGDPLTVSGVGPILINVAATIQSVIAGNVGLTKSGTGTLRLSAANTYTGTTTISGGTLSGNVASFLPANSNVTVSTGGTLAYATANLTYNALNVTLNGGSLTGADYDTSIPGTFTLGAGTTSTISNGGRKAIFFGNFTGTGNLNSTAAGNRYFLSGTNDYSGTTRLSGVTGNVVFTKPSALYNGVQENWTPAKITVNSGAILGIRGGNGTTTGFDSTQINTLLGNLSTVSNNGLLAGSLVNIDAEGDFNYTGVIRDSSGPGGGSVGVYVTPGMLTLSGPNTYTGKTIWRGYFAGESTTLSVSSFNSVSTNPALGTVHSASSNLGAPTTVAAGTLDIGSDNAQVSSSLIYTGTGETTDRVLNIAGNNVSDAIISQSGSGLLKFTSNFTQPGNNPTPLTLTGSGNGEIAGGIPALGNLTKSGSGTWTLSGTNTYTGETTVSTGKLFINGNQSAANGVVSIAALATLGGTGTMGGSTTIDDTGKLEFNLSTPAGSHDRLEMAAAKTLTFSGVSTLTITFTAGASPGLYTLIAGGNNIVGAAPTTVILPDGWAADPPVIVGNELRLNITSTGSSAYDAWKVANAPGSNPGDDSDGDGISNALELVLGGTSATKDIDKLPVSSTSETDMIFTFYRAQSSIDPKTSVSIEVGTDLVTWTAPPSPYAVPDGAATNNPGVTVLKNNPAIGTDKITLTVPKASATKKFTRLKVVITP